MQLITRSKIRVIVNLTEDTFGGGLKAAAIDSSDGKDKSLYALDKYSNFKTTWIQIAGKGSE